MSRRTKAFRVHEEMRRLGIERDDAHCFGSPRISGIKVSAIADRFAAGENEFDLADDYGITDIAVRDALRFALLFPRYDMPSFWKELEGKSK